MGAAGFRIVAIKPGHAEIALARRDDLLQFFGHFHGGIISALADHAAGIAVTSALPKGKIGVTVEIKVNFLSPADGIELIARAKTLKMSGSIGVATVAFAPLQGPLQEEAADESETFQVRGSESLEAKHLIDARFRRGSEMAAVIAYRRDSQITSEDRERILDDARAICRSAELPSLTLVGTPYGLGCGTDDPLDLSPGPSLLISRDATVSLSSALMTDDSTPDRGVGGRARSAGSSRRPKATRPGCGPTSPARPASRPTAARRSRASTRRCCSSPARCWSCCCSRSTARRWSRWSRSSWSRVAYVVACGLTYMLVARRHHRGERADDGDPDRADVRRGHGLLPADRGPLPRRAAPDRGCG